MSATTTTSKKPVHHGVKEFDAGLNPFQDLWFILRPTPMVHDQRMLHIGLNRLGVEQFYPMVTRSRRLGRGAMRVTREPYLTGYIPIKLTAREQKEQIERLQGFLTFMRPPGSIERYYMLTPEGMEYLGKKSREVVVKSEKKMPFELGQMLKVVDGPFATFGGRVIETDSKHLHVTLELEIFGRPTPAEFETWQLEKEEGDLPPAERIR